jgi:hypothetical protein
MTPPSASPNANLVNYVLVDGENIPDVDLGLFGDKTIHLILLFGARKSKLNVDLVEKLVEHASSVKFIRLTSPGKNALDFALAFYLGQAAASDPAASFHLVSKDTGYDPLIAHLRRQHLSVQRHDDYSFLPFQSKPAKKAATKTAIPEPDLISRAVDGLRKCATNRPKKKKGLLGTLKNYLNKDATDRTRDDLLEKLISEGYVSIGEKDAVAYHLSEE